VIAWRKVYLVVKAGIVGIIKDKEPAFICCRKDLKCFGDTLNYAPKQLCNDNKITLSGGRLVDINPKYPPEPIA
jgi:hypothetical protein